jgi:hypothetical protein
LEVSRIAPSSWRTSDGTIQEGIVVKLTALVPDAVLVGCIPLAYDLPISNNISNDVVVLLDAGVTALVLVGGRFAYLPQVPVDAVDYEKFDYVRLDWTPGCSW